MKKIRCFGKRNCIPSELRKQIAAAVVRHLPSNPWVISESSSMATNPSETTSCNRSRGSAELLALHMCAHARVRGMLERSPGPVQSTAASLLFQIPNQWCWDGASAALGCGSSCLAPCVGIHPSCRYASACAGPAVSIHGTQPAPSGVALPGRSWEPKAGVLLRDRRKGNESGTSLRRAKVYSKRVGTEDGGVFWPHFKCTVAHGCCNLASLASSLSGAVWLSWKDPLSSCIDNKQQQNPQITSRNMLLVP